MKNSARIFRDVPFPLLLWARYRRPTVSKAIGRARSSMYAHVSGRAPLVCALRRSRTYIGMLHRDDGISLSLFLSRCIKRDSRPPRFRLAERRVSPNVLVSCSIASAVHANEFGSRDAGLRAFYPTRNKCCLSDLTACHAV